MDEHAAGMETATLVVALWTSNVTGAGSRHSIACSSVRPMAATAQLLWDSTGSQGLVGLLTAPPHGRRHATVIGIGVVNQREVNAGLVRGATRVYLLAGLFFVFIYGTLAVLGDGPFFAQGTDPDSGRCACITASSRSRRSAMATTRLPATSGGRSRSRRSSVSSIS